MTTEDLGDVGVDWDLPPVEPLQVGVGVLVVLAGLVLARLVGAGVRWWLRRRGRSRSYADVFGTLGAWAVGILATLAALTIAFPSVQPVDVLGGVGILSIAVGIAFQDILSNLFAGVLLLVREPFRTGDQVAVGEVRGTVEAITLRETVVRTFDGRRVLIPNSTVHGGVVSVQTGYEQVRTAVAVGVAYSTDLGRAREVALGAMREVPLVLSEPEPQALVTTLGASTIDLELRFWSGARQLETLEAKDAVIRAVVKAYDSAGIEMPAEIRVLEAGPTMTSALEQVARDT